MVGLLWGYLSIFPPDPVFAKVGCSRIQQPKMSIGEYGFISLAIDSEGNMFGLHSMK
jgi:predicted enzyme related to lactoylglutathione lyase